GVVPGRARSANAEEMRARLGVVDEAWRIVNDEYYDAARLDGQRLSYAEIKGLLDALGDAHTTFADPQRARQQEDDIRGGFDGIGISVEVKDGRLLIARVLDESPALAAGLRVGDAITRIDDEDVQAPTLDGMVRRIRGPRGSPVRLTVERQGGSGPLQIAVTRGEIKTSPVRARVLPGN